jgi:DNA-binding MurR/RpiR family transcriptional regulator
METHYLAEILNTVPLENFDRAVRILLEGKNLFLFGIGHSRILVELLQMRLQRLGIHTICLVEAGRDLLDKLLLLRKDDAVLIAAYHRITGELTAVLRHAQRVGCRTVILTDIPELESYRKADVVLYALRGPVHSFHPQRDPSSFPLLTTPDRLFLGLSTMWGRCGAWGSATPTRADPKGRMGNVIYE